MVDPWGGVFKRAVDLGARVGQHGSPALDHCRRADASQVTLKNI